MKKFLEVLVDDDGNLHLNTDYEFADSVENPPTDMNKFQEENDLLLKQDTLNRMWILRRYLSMAEIISDVQPYDNAEQLWSAMMFYFIPHYEKFSTQLKKPYGFNPSRVIRPMTFGSFPGCSTMPISGFGPKKN